jgi:hypothetical protein
MYIVTSKPKVIKSTDSTFKHTICPLVWLNWASHVIEVGEKKNVNGLLMGKTIRK